MSSRIYLPLSSVLVGISQLSTSSSFSASKRPCLIVVPPTSIPNAYLSAICVPFLQLSACSCISLHRKFSLLKNNTSAGAQRTPRLIYSIR